MKFGKKNLIVYYKKPSLTILKQELYSTTNIT